MIPLPRRRPGHQCPADRARWEKVQRTAPGHVANVQRNVINALTAEQIGQLTAITDAIPQTLDADGTTITGRSPF